MKPPLLIACLAVALLSLNPSLQAAPEKPGAEKKVKPVTAPKFPKYGTWLNTKKKITSEFFSNRLTLVYFWDYSSGNCLREINFLKSWYELYKPYGLEMIWIHSPEFSFAKQKKNVIKAVERLKIPFPVFLDNEFKVWDAYKVKAWPAKILVDGEKHIVHSQLGEGRYMEMEAVIRRKLKEMNLETVLPPVVFEAEPEKYLFEECGDMTAETYVGHKRAGWWGGKIANKQYAAPDQTTMFKDRGDRVQRGFFLEGMWTNLEDHMLHARDTQTRSDYIGLVYLGYEVYSVVANRGKKADARVYVTRDGEPVPPGYRGVDIREDEAGDTYFTTDTARLYYLITNENDELHEIKLWPETQGIAVFSFAFANRCLSDFEHL